MKKPSTNRVKFTQADVDHEEEIEASVLNTDYFKLRALAKKHGLIVAQRDALLLLATELAATLRNSKDKEIRKSAKAWEKGLLLIADGEDLFKEELILMLDAFKPESFNGR